MGAFSEQTLDGSAVRGRTSPIDRILTKLECVAETGNSTWLARCPSHRDEHPSLSIKEVDGGTILINCFAGCSAYEIVSSLGMRLGDLFPPRNHNGKPLSHQERKRYGQAADALRVLRHEAGVILLAGIELQQTSQHRERLQLAVNRVRYIVGMAV